MLKWIPSYPNSHAGVVKTRKSGRCVLQSAAWNSKSQDGPQKLPGRSSEKRCSPERQQPQSPGAIEKSQSLGLKELRGLNLGYDPERIELEETNEPLRQQT